MLQNARNPRSPSVHHGIVRLPADPDQGKWRGTLCDRRHGALTRNGVQVLEETTDPVTCRRCLAVAARRAGTVRDHEGPPNGAGARTPEAPPSCGSTTSADTRDGTGPNGPPPSAGDVTAGRDRRFTRRKAA